MKKVVLGTLLGVGAAYVYHHMKENGQLDKLADEVNDFTSKTKKKIKDTIDAGVNEVEYVKDRAGYKVDKGIAKGKEAINKKTSY